MTTPELAIQKGGGGGCKTCTQLMALGQRDAFVSIGPVLLV